jgi:putative phosphonate metabolism protein
MAHRYAIYWAPPRDHPLWHAGCAWLGRDPETGETFAPPLLDGLDRARHAAITAEPARYAWHATLKPPFRLAAGETEASLDTAMSRFAATRSAFPAPTLAVSVLSGFLAVTPAEPSPMLDALAAECVAAFDPFRAPPEAAERARRRAAGLSARQESLLARWGYPYVMEEFRFHLTLTTRLPAEEAERMRRALGLHLADALSAPVMIDAIALYAEPAPAAPFTLLRRYPLAREL